MRLIRQTGRLFAGLVISLCSLAATAASIAPLTILQVTAATDGSDGLVVSGRVDTAAGISSFDINGTPVSNFDGENFDVQVSPASIYEVNLYKMDGSSEQVVYNDPTASVESAVQVVIGNQMMMDVGAGLGRLLADLDLNAVLGISPNECVINTWYLIGCDFYLDEMAIQGTPEIDLFFTPGSRQALTINIRVKIPSAVMKTRLKRSYWFGYDRTSMTTNDIEVFFQLGVAATSNQSVKLILDDPSDIQMHIGRMSVRSTNLAAYMIPLFKDAVTGLVNRHVANVVGPLLNLLPIPSIPLALPVDLDGDGTNDAEFAINLAPELLDVLPGGDGQAVISGAISSKTVAPGREVLGSRTIPSVLPGANAVMGNTDLTAAVSVNLVNQVLTAVYQSGLDSALALPLTIGDLGGFGQIFSVVGYGPTDPLKISLGFGAQPELQVNSSSLYGLGLDMAMPALHLVMSVPNADGEDVVLDMVADFNVDTSLGADGNGALFLEFNNLLSLSHVTINGGSLTNVIAPSALEGLIGFGLTLVINEFQPTINELLNSARLELDIGQVLTDWLNTEFPSVNVAGYVTEAGVSPDESYLQVGLGVDVN